MSSLHSQVLAKEAEVIQYKTEIRTQLNNLRQGTLDKLSSPHTLIWSGIIGFVVGRIFQPSIRSVLFSSWPILRKVGQPTWEKIVQYLE